MLFKKQIGELFTKQEVNSFKEDVAYEDWLNTYNPKPADNELVDMEKTLSANNPYYYPFQEA